MGELNTDNIPPQEPSVSSKVKIKTAPEIDISKPLDGSGGSKPPTQPLKE